MKKASKEMLREILSNQQLIMKALKIVVPAKKAEAKKTNKIEVKKAITGKPVKRAAR